MDALDELGHTILYTYHLREISLIYLAIPNLVSHVIISAADAHVCAQAGIPKQLSEQEMENENAVTVVQGQELAILMKECGKTDMEIEKAINGKEIWGWQNPWSSSDQFKRSTCVQRKGAEDGIPVWKIFSFHFWSGTSHPLGAPWTLSPEDYSSHPVHKFTTEHNFYLGYSVEKYCSVHRQPLEERLDRALVFAKDTKYFEEGNNMFWNQDRTFQDLKERTGIQFLALANSADTVLPDPGLTNEGRQSIDVFYDHLGKSRVLIGIGRPPLSPTPYDALCLGVPFLNPIIYWDHDNPSHMSAWACQHDGLLATGKPYVHHVHAGDLRGLEEAIQHARENPFDAYILPSMTPHANRVRHQMLMNLNFRSLGKDYILRRRAQGHYIPFMI